MGIVPRHQIRSPECLAQFVQPLVSRPAGLSDIHQEIFAFRPDTIDAGLVRDLIEGVFVCTERDPWGPRKGAPVLIKKIHISSQVMSYTRDIR